MDHHSDTDCAEIFQNDLRSLLKDNHYFQKPAGQKHQFMILHPVLYMKRKGISKMIEIINRIEKEPADRIIPWKFETSHSSLLNDIYLKIVQIPTPIHEIVAFLKKFNTPQFIYSRCLVLKNSDSEHGGSLPISDLLLDVLLADVVPIRISPIMDNTLLVYIGPTCSISALQTLQATINKYIEQRSPKSKSPPLNQIPAQTLVPFNNTTYTVKTFLERLDQEPPARILPWRLENLYEWFGDPQYLAFQISSNPITVQQQIDNIRQPNGNNLLDKYNESLILIADRGECGAPLTWYLVEFMLLNFISVESIVSLINTFNIPTDALKHIQNNINQELIRRTLNHFYS